MQKHSQKIEHKIPQPKSSTTAKIPHHHMQSLGKILCKNAARTHKHKRYRHVNNLSIPNIETSLANEQ